MSRDSESTRATQRSHPADHAHAVDFEAEHRPDVARRASLAGLQRHAATLPNRTDGESAPASHAEHGIADATVDERRAQAVVANGTGTEAITTGLRFAAKGLLTSAQQIKHILAEPPGMAGMDRQLRAVEQVFEHARDIVERMSMELGLVRNSDLREGNELKHALSVFERAHVVFNVSLTKAQNYALHDPQQQLNVQPKALQDRITHMFDARGWTVQEATAVAVKPGEMDHRILDLQRDSTDHLVMQALEANAEATRDHAHLMRMRLTSAPDEVLNHSFGRTIAHLSELAALLEQAPPKALRSQKPVLRQVLHEVRSLEEEVAGKPALASKVAPGSAFYMALRKIGAKVGKP